jgi:peroxiredoxin
VSDIPSRLSRWEPSRLVKTTFLAFAAACVFALFFAKWFQATVGERRKLEAALQAERVEGAPPPFRLKDRTGREVSLADLRGKVVFLNFWATWCAPCREEMPSLAALARSIDARDAAFVAVSVDEGWGEVDQFAAKTPLPFTVLLDAERAVSTAYGSVKFPESFVIGKDGRLLYKIVGARDWGTTAARKLLEHAGARRVVGTTSP